MAYSNDTKPSGGSYTEDTKPSTASYADDTKPTVGTAETWASVLTTWATETRTWSEMVGSSNYAFDAKPS